MRRARWTLKPAPESSRPVIYHCISRVVERRMHFGADEKEQLRTLMRMYERFSGNRVLAYCFMSNHIHILLEVTPMPVDGLTDAELLARLRAINNEAEVFEVARQLKEARAAVAAGGGAEEVLVGAIHRRYTYRMHDLSQFMKGFLRRYSQWHNRRHKRKGHLWEERFKSVIVEDGLAARTMAAYIDLNPVRAHMAASPEDYRWSSYGEAVGGGPKGDGKKARQGLVRALRCHDGGAAEAAAWGGGVAAEYRRLLLAGLGERAEDNVMKGEELEKRLKQLQKRLGRTPGPREIQEAQLQLVEAEKKRLGEIALGRLLRCRVRYFSDGVVIGSRGFVDGLFATARERFGPRRTSGARKMRGNAAAAGLLWSMRDLRDGVAE